LPLAITLGWDKCSHAFDFCPGLRYKKRTIVKDLSGLRPWFLFAKNMPEQPKPASAPSSGEARQDNAWQTALVIFFRLSVWIGVPIVVAVFLGKWLDQKYQTEPWLFLATVGAAFVVSMFGLIKETMKEFKKIDDHKKEDK
jgi:F0F1-type ATP synthase assembly protein I